MAEGKAAHAGSKHHEGINAIDALARGTPVATVARSHGYRSASAFAAAFREVVGVSPREIPG
jgi:AraC-like DNA-binding protein